MRARAGDPPRTMAQKILAARASDPTLAGERVEVQVDQVVLARTPARAFDQALALGLKRSPVELAIAYDGRCVTDGGPEESIRASPADMSAHGLLIARPGVGYPAPVHIERFASPARLCVTDEPRLAGVGGIGMLTLVLPSRQLGQALARGTVVLRPPVSIHVLLAGRLRPFVCARDVSLELVRRGLGDVVRDVEEARGAPVVLEYTGPSVRMLSVGERSVLAALGAQVGAMASLFVSDERTEVFLRDQRRSKAHRALSPDPGAPTEQVVNVDLGAVDPLLQDEHGQIRAVRDLAGEPVSQALLGGDSGITLRDLFAAATLLKSKRVPARLDFLLALPSRQMLEVLAAAGALTDLIATGARLLEPDSRVMTGELYPPSPSGMSIRTFDRQPRIGRKDKASARGATVVSAETLAYAVANGELGDPRSFKRPVRVTVPRALPTDDVLVARKLERTPAALIRQAPTPEMFPGPVSFMRTRGELALEIRRAGTFELRPPARGPSSASPQSSPKRSAAPLGIALVCESLDEVRAVSARASELSAEVRAVLAAYVPMGHVELLAAAGISAFRAEARDLPKWVDSLTLVFSSPVAWARGASAEVTPTGPSGHASMVITWLGSVDEGASGGSQTGTQPPVPFPAGLAKPAAAPGEARDPPSKLRRRSADEA